MARMAVSLLLAVAALLSASLGPAAAQFTLNAKFELDTTNSLSLDSAGTGYALCRTSGAYTSNADFIKGTLTVTGVAGDKQSGTVPGQPSDPTLHTTSSSTCTELLNSPTARPKPGNGPLNLGSTCLCSSVVAYSSRRVNGVTVITEANP
jgi:hypothetical protein